jgi:N-acetylglutamate synthase
MTLADYDAVFRLWKVTEGVGLSEADTRPAIESFLARNPDLSFVALDGAETVGAVLCGHDGRRGYLHHLAVARSHRGRGLGKGLVEACLAGLRQLGIQKCNLFLFSNHAAGETFWKYNGWRHRADLQVMQTVLGPTE